MPKSLERTIVEERLKFLTELGLDDSILDRFGLPKTLASGATMRASHQFFSDLGADVQRVYREYPQLLAHHRENDLDPKLQFLVDEIRISRRTVARLPELFTYSLDSMKNTYRHYVNEFGRKIEQAKALLRDATTIFGNDTALIDDKIRKYREAGIDFHRNYTLLEIKPEKVIDTRAYLTELGVQEPETGKWYHILLTVSRDTLQPKVDYCKREGIAWRKYPRVLILGLGTDEKPGALPRRVNLIKNAFQDRPIPPELDYKSKPFILDSPDEKLRNRIERYR